MFVGDSQIYVSQRVLEGGTFITLCDLSLYSGVVWGGRRDRLRVFEFFKTAELEKKPEKNLTIFLIDPCLELLLPNPGG